MIDTETKQGVRSRLRRIARQLEAIEPMQEEHFDRYGQVRER